MTRGAIGCCLILLASGCLVGEEEEIPEVDTAYAVKPLKNNTKFSNSFGWSATFSTEGQVALDGPFFGDFGTNGRTCGSCHLASDGWTISASRVQSLFNSTNGTHPMFRTVDGANSPLADVSTVAARSAAYSMLRTRGVIRVGIGIPANAEFELLDVDDPYGFASAAELSLFRRPLPSTNLGLIPAVMWDGRVAGATVDEALAAQSNGATLGHAQATTPLTAAQRQAIVDFETSLTTAQFADQVLGGLDVDGARGGPELLAEESRVNQPFNLYDAWSGSAVRRRAAIARGQALFNTKTRPNGLGACRGCHNVGNAGSGLNPIFFDVGVSAGSRRTADMPLYTLHNLATDEIRTTTDPGRALITGKWADVDKFKPPVLRALPARAPYFHNGSAATLQEVVTFYETSLGFDFTAAEEADLVAFLSAL